MTFASWLARLERRDDDVITDSMSPPGPSSKFASVRTTLHPAASAAPPALRYDERPVNAERLVRLPAASKLTKREPMCVSACQRMWNTCDSLWR